jgi:hypothetical protein
MGAVDEGGCGVSSDTTAARASSRTVRMAKRRQRLETFADLIADGHTVVSAAQAMGVGTATATGYMRDLRAGLEVGA